MQKIRSWLPSFGLLSALAGFGVALNLFGEFLHSLLTAVWEAAHRPDPLWTLESARWIWTRAGWAAFLGLLPFLLILWGLPRFVRWRFRPQLKTRPNPDRSARALILFLSSQGVLNPKTVLCRIEDPGLPTHIGRSPWLMPLLSLRQQCRHGRLDRVIVIGSADSPGNEDGTWRQADDFINLARRLWPEDSPAPTFVHGAGSRDGQPSGGVDFWDPPAVLLVLERVYQELNDEGYGNHDILIDITSGGNGASVAGGLAAFSPQRRSCYVRHTPGGLAEFYVQDLYYALGPEGSLVNRLLAAIPGEIIPKVEDFATAVPRTRWPVAILLMSYQLLVEQSIASWRLLAEGRVVEAAGALGMFATLLFIAGVRARRVWTPSRLSIVVDKTRPRALLLGLSELASAEYRGAVEEALNTAGLPSKDPSSLLPEHHPWQVSLAAVRGVKHAVVVPSRESAAQARQFVRLIEQAYGIDAEVLDSVPDVQRSWWATLGLAGSPRPPRLESAPDYYSVNELAIALDYAYEMLQRRPGVSARNIVFDITSGTKIFSLVATATASRYHCPFQVSSSRKQIEVRRYRAESAYGGE